MFRLFPIHLTFDRLIGTSAATLPRCLSNFRAIWLLQHPITWHWDNARFGGTTSYRVMNRGSEPVFICARTCRRTITNWLMCPNMTLPNWIKCSNTIQMFAASVVYWIIYIGSNRRETFHVGHKVFSPVPLMSHAKQEVNNNFRYQINK